MIEWNSNQMIVAQMMAADDKDNGKNDTSSGAGMIGVMMEANEFKANGSSTKAIPKSLHLTIKAETLSGLW